MSHDVSASATSLYVIGNGFDLYHGLSTSFDDFKNYLKTADKELFDHIHDRLLIEPAWGNFEEALASLDVDRVREEAANYLVDYGDEDWSDAYHHDYQWAINQVVDPLSINLKKRFAEWLATIDIPSPTTTGRALLDLDPTAQYINFNYTPTLERIYGIDANRILHIHGKSVDALEEIVLGHGRNWSDEQPIRDPEELGNMDPRISEGESIITSYFASTYKPALDIIELHASVFQSVASVERIYVLGHSMSSVDLDYFREIVRIIDSARTQWYVTFYNKGDVQRHRETMRVLGIAPVNIRLLELSGLARGKAPVYLPDGADSWQLDFFECLDLPELQRRSVKRRNF